MACCCRVRGVEAADTPGRMESADAAVARLSVRQPSEADLWHRYFAELRRRGLFGLAELEALRRLKDPQSWSDWTVELTIELSETLAAHAVERPPAEAATLWKHAEQQIEQLLDRLKDDPRRMEVEVQRGRLRYLRALAGLLLRELRVPPEEWRADAEEVARVETALVELETLAKRLEAGPTSDTGEQVLSATRREQLRRSLFLWIGSGYCELCLHATRGRYLPISALFRDQATADVFAGFARERLDAWERAALRWLDRLKIRGASPSAAEREAAWRRAQILRVMGRLDEAGGLLTSLGTEPGDPLTQRVAAERTRLLVARSAVLEAADGLLAVRRRVGTVSAELHYLNGVVLFELAGVARDAGKAEAADELKLQAEAHLRRAEGQGGFWGQWARRERRRREVEAEVGRDLARRLERAEWLLELQRFDQAAKAYGEAAVAAYREQRMGVAFDAAYRRASLLYRLQRWPEAHVAFAELSERFAQNPQAASAALLAADALIRWSRQQPNVVGPERVETFLAEAAKRFDGRPGALSLRRMLARWYETRGRFVSALRQYERIVAADRKAARAVGNGAASDRPGDAPRPAEWFAALAGVARCYERIIAEAPADGPEGGAAADRSPPRAADRAIDDRAVIRGRSRVQWTSDAIDRLEALVENGRRWSAEQPAAEVAMPWMETLLRLARMELVHRPGADVRADRLLKQALELGSRLEGQLADEDDRRTLDGLIRAARQLRVISLASQGRIQEARELLRTVAGSNTDHLLAVIDGLTAAARTGEPELRRRLADLQLMAAAMLVGEEARSVGAGKATAQRRELTPEQKVRVYSALAEAFAETRQPQRAVDAVRKALRLAPRDRALRLRFARLLVECGDRTCLAEALALWRWIEQSAAEGSREFLEARGEIVRCLLGLGQRDAALKLARVTRLLYETDEYPELWQELHRLEAAATRDGGR
ncbi:MAG: hypothetical protein D6725_02270 [Planctomycetota bacterium]|nr:MAG: hypothetical protein D6725_02270 [Planctomycetota bacterium]